MQKIFVLKKTDDKMMREETVKISCLGIEVCCIFVPFKRKLKRKDKTKLTKIIENANYVFTEEAVLQVYEKGVCDYSWLSLFPLEGIQYLIKKPAFDQIAVVSAALTDLLKKILLCLGENCRIVTLYTVKTCEVQQFLEELYCSIGLPVQIKELLPEVRPAERWLVRVSNSVKLYDSNTGIEYEDFAIEFLHPLSQYKDLPLQKIIKVGLQNGMFSDLFQSGMVKIVGEISK